MSIEINGAGGPAVHGTAENAASEATRARADASRERSGHGPSTDTFELTDRASRMQRLEAEIAAQPEVDTRRVEEVRRALATGTLEIDPQRVAEKLLSFEAGLGRPDKG